MDERFHLPHKFAENYCEALKTLLYDYSRAIEQTSASDDWTVSVRDKSQQISDISQLVMKAVHARLESRIPECEDYIDKLVETAKPDFGVWATNDREFLKVLKWFRLRSGSPAEQFEPHDLFHVPLSKRRILGQHRYGLPGVPCLYLGATSYVCWEELGRPDLNRLWMSAYEVTNVRVLDLGYSPQAVACDQGDRRCLGERALRQPLFMELVVAYSILYPIIAAASFERSRSAGSVFHPEYILPQALLRAVLKRPHCYDAIRYLSSRVPAGVNTPWLAGNLVIPVKDYNSTEFCSRLQKMTKMTNPLPWQLMAACNMEGDNQSRGEIQLASGDIRIPYKNTDFARMDQRISDLNFCSLSEHQ